MARQPRFILPGQVHLVMQRGHNSAHIVHDTGDAAIWQDILRDVAATQRVAVHAWHLGDTRFCLLVTPPQAAALSRLVQDLGRRYVGAFNARHGRSGTLWDGRFRCAAVEPGACEMDALLYVEGAAGDDPARASRAHHLGLCTEPWLSDPPAYWSLGNTPFERQGAWRAQLEQGLTPTRLAQIEVALSRGTPLASLQRLQELQAGSPRRLLARPRGRPPRSVA